MTSHEAPHQSAAASDREPTLRLDGRTVVVTGSGGGIGAGIARVIARTGAVVAVNDIDERACSTVADEIVAHDGKAFAVPGDVTDEPAARRLIDTVAELAGGLDGLVNNAGIPGPRRFDEIGAESWNQVLALNLAAPFRLSVLAAPHLRKTGHGRIVNVASIAGTRVSVLGGAAYTSSKAGLIGMTRHLAMELAQDGVTVNAILPGVTMTPLIAAHTNPETLEEIRGSVPLGRTGTPEDVGWLTAFLLSDLAGYISGTATEVDGALTVLPGDYAGYRRMRGEADAS